MWKKLLEIIGFKKPVKTGVEEALEFYKLLRSIYYTKDYTIGFCECIRSINVVCNKNYNLRQCTLLIEEFKKCYPLEYKEWYNGKAPYWFTIEEGWDIRMELVDGVINKLKLWQKKGIL